jgi:hypothetical protein
VVARGIAESLKSAQQPLVLAAVDEVHPVFREVCGGPHLVEPGIFGSPDKLSDSELHQAALKVLEAGPSGTARAICERYRRAARTPLASRELEQIVVAASQRRVDVLISGLGERIWGTWDAESRRVSFQDGNGPQRVDLIDLALHETLRHGGDVCVLPCEQVPDLMRAVAILRW